MPEQALQQWLQGLPALSQTQRQQLAANSQLIELAAGSIIFQQGQNAELWFIVLKGRAEVYKTTASGKELLLYSVEVGESCVLTTSGLLGQSSYPAEGRAASDILAIALPSQQFQRLLSESEAFRELVFQAYGQRIAELIELVDNVAFTPVAQRLAQRLRHEMDTNGELTTTHQKLALEIGCAREVISRHLKQFEQQGLIQQGRAQIRIIDPQALQARAQPPV